MTGNSGFEISFFEGMGSVLAYFGACLLVPTALDILIWRKLDSGLSPWPNLVTVILLNCLFFVYLSKNKSLRFDFLENISLISILAAVACAVLFYLLLDSFLDPVFERMFPASEASYQATLDTLRLSPVASFIRVAVFASVTEEMLMRGYLLHGLQARYGVAAALIISSLLFAALHFNFVQTLSAFVMGLLLGLLYIKTQSLSSCILTHALYNSLSFFMMMAYRS